MLEPILLGHRSFRETVLNALAARGHLILCRNGDEFFYVDPSDRGIGNALMWHGDWQRAEIDRAIALIADRLKPGAVFVDIGANIGTQSVYALRSGRFARAVAFEPEPRNANILRMNMSVNNLDHCAVVIEKAVGERNGTATLHLHPRNKGHHTLDMPPSYDGLESRDIEVVRVDDALARAGIELAQVGLVWMDVEGYEPQAVQGLGALIERAVPLAIEYAPERYGADRRSELIALLARHYTSLHNLNGPRGAAQPVTAIHSVGNHADLLLT